MEEEEIKTVAEKILEQENASEIVRTPETVRKISKEEVEDVFKSLKQQSSEQPLVDKVIDNIVDDIVKGKAKDEDEDFELLNEEEIKSKYQVFSFNFYYCSIIVAAEASKNEEGNCYLQGKSPSPVLVECAKKMEDSGINLPDIVPQEPIMKKESDLTMEDSGVGPEPPSAELQDRPSTPVREEIAILEGKIAQLDESIDLKDELTDSSLDLYDNFDNMASPTPKSPLPAVDYDLFGSISPPVAAEAPAQPSTQPRKSVVFSDHVQEKMISPASSMSSNERIDAEDYFTRSDDEKARLEAELDELMDGFTEEIEKREKTPEQNDLLGTFKLDSPEIQELDSDCKEYFPVEILKDDVLPKETESEEVKTIDTECDLEAVSKLEEPGQSISHEGDVINTDRPADSLSKEDDVEKVKPKEKEETIGNSENANYLSSAYTSQDSSYKIGVPKTLGELPTTVELTEKDQIIEDKSVSVETPEISEPSVIDKETQPEKESEKETLDEIHEKAINLSVDSEEAILSMEQTQNITSETYKPTEHTKKSKTNDAIPSEECINAIEKTEEFQDNDDKEIYGESVDPSEKAVLEQENTKEDTKIPIQSDELSPDNIEPQNDSSPLKEDSVEETETTTVETDSSLSADRSTAEIESLAALTVSEILMSAQAQAKSNQEGEEGDESENIQKSDASTAINEDTNIQRNNSEKETETKNIDEIVTDTLSETEIKEEILREKFDVPPQFKEIPFEPIKEKEIEVILQKEEEKDLPEFVVEKDEPKLQELKSSEAVTFGENHKIRTEKVLSFASFSNEKTEGESPNL